ncbi:DUF368 domain-containing protein [Halorarum salinum]|uniref:DUF368 domain-containing protein n=1 Tax=Halorarum salinum TaxID=2743089 RepID=A0A7D5QDG6_9EURY|nr:DUF368 domain-containing protein [Halobaculum salinum]QLG64098.1 DUF368 domain-containing protein [Halobaculum salinum]
MGTADAVPGVSGGTIALITGIYDRLIAAVTAFDADLLGRALTGLTGDRNSLREAWREADATFLLVLGVGILAAVLTITRVLHVAIETRPAPTFGFFFGLIAASAIVLRDELHLDSRRRITAAVTGAALAFLVSGQASAVLPNSPATTAFAGAFAVSAMILPGISGSLVLVILGQYERMSGALSAFQDAVIGVAGGADPSTLVAPGTTVVSFIAGGVVGLLSIAHLIRRALERDRETTMAFLVGLIVGALRAPVSSAGENLAELGRGWTPETVGLFVVAGLVGALAIFAIDRAAGGIEL